MSATHDWSRTVDLAHLEAVRRAPFAWAPGGVLHLVLEVLAYAAEEAEDRARAEGDPTRRGRCRVVLGTDGSVAVADDGRGTQTRVEAGNAVRKPVMATRDLRFGGPGEDRGPGPLLPDGHPRRGMSVVSALSVRLVHLNRRREGSWTQDYARGVPVSDLVPVAPDGTTGTTVTFRPDPHLAPAPRELDVLTRWAALAVEVVDERGP
ncbi:ATP-binding protein [Actinotalea solisilvae]|uniref:ATP-binding protein n=1 Tax=Actinotalea solisilvae TaxID=2072922 RepID=UPI0018F26385|nr:ATP-binding protein [Actinotalea solisilvae]